MDSALQALFFLSGCEFCFGLLSTDLRPSRYHHQGAVFKPVDQPLQGKNTWLDLAVQFRRGCIDKGFRTLIVFLTAGAD